MSTQARMFIWGAEGAVARPFCQHSSLKNNTVD